MSYTIPFEEAYEMVIENATEGVDVESVYRNLGMDPEYADEVGKLAVALVIMESGCTQGPVPAVAAYSIKRAARNLIERGQVGEKSPSAAAETMDKMRHLI
jgi:hypothetical protein